MAEKQIFKVRLEKHENSEATGITIPFDVEAVFGAKRVPVKISINGAEYYSTVMKMNGRYMLAVPKILRDAANIKAGETIEVTMEKDAQKRAVDMPEDLTKALNNADLTDVFAKMSYTHQKEYVKAIEDAKREETRMRRIEKTIEQLISKRR